MDPEQGIPGTGLFFQTKGGRIDIFATSWPKMPARAKTRLLEAYLREAGPIVEVALIGGSMTCSLGSAESMMAKMSTPTEFLVNGSLSLFIRCWISKSIFVAISSFCTMRRKSSKSCTMQHMSTGEPMFCASCLKALSRRLPKTIHGVRLNVATTRRCDLTDCSMCY